MKLPKTWLQAILVGSLAILILSACGSDTETGDGDGSESGAPPQSRVGMATGPAGSGPYLIGAEIANVVNGSSEFLRVSNQASGGFAENFDLVSTGQAEFALGFDPDLTDAFRGEGIFDEERGELRRMFTATLYVSHIVTQEGSGIERVEDFEGRTVNIGAPAQATRGMNDRLLEVVGLSVDDIDSQPISTGESFGAIQDGILDATSNVYSIGFSGLLDLANNIDIELVDIPDDVFEDLNDLFDGTLVRLDIPGGTYPGIDDDVQSFAVPGVAYTHADVSDDAVYDMTRYFWENITALEEDDAFQDISLDILRSGSPVPEHPGAARYLDEIGAE